MKVKFATQVISRTVAAGLETHATLKCGHGSDTAEFITIFDELFDALNSSQRTTIKNNVLFQKKVHIYRCLKNA